MYSGTAAAIFEAKRTKGERERERERGSIMSDLIEALNLITSSKIHELYQRQSTEDPLVLRKKVCSIPACKGRAALAKPRGSQVAPLNYPVVTVFGVPLWLRGNVVSAFCTYVCTTNAPLFCCKISVFQEVFSLL